MKYASRILLLASLAVASLPAAFAANTGGFTANGHVTDGTAGIPGVYVSDGFEFGCTDAAGYWELPVDDNAKYVFVILPSGYEHTDVTNGIIRHYGVIDRSGSSYTKDFTLSPIGDDTKFSFLVQADPQPNPLITDQCFTKLGTAYTDILDSAKKLKAADGFNPVVLMLGDITHEIGYEEYKVVLRQVSFNVPLFPVPGNHDKQLKLPTYEEQTARYQGTFGPTYYSFNRGKLHFVMLDNVSSQGDGNYNRGVSAEATAWMKKDLELVPEDCKVVLCGHIPYTAKLTDISKYKPVLNLVENRDAMILSGHMHRITPLEPYSGTCAERMQMSLCGHIWRGPCGKDGCPNGYYLYYVDGTDVSWKFKPTGKDEDKNMFRIYEPGQFDDNYIPASGDRTVEVNVWDWDKEWKVTWSLDGVEQGDLPRYESHLDPLAVYNYSALDENHQPAASAHMFHCEVPQSGSLVKVTVTDRFGRTLSKTLELESGIESIESEYAGVALTEVFNAQGVPVCKTAGLPEIDTLPVPAGIYIFRLTLTDGSVKIFKETKI